MSVIGAGQDGACHIRGGLGKAGLQHSPAFFVVKYIIRFFFFPERLPHRVPGCREMGK